MCVYSHIHAYSYRHVSAKNVKAGMSLGELEARASPLSSKHPFVDAKITQEKQPDRNGFMTESNNFLVLKIANDCQVSFQFLNTYLHLFL